MIITSGRLCKLWLILYTQMHWQLSKPPKWIFRISLSYARITLILSILMKDIIFRMSDILRMNWSETLRRYSTMNFNNLKGQINSWLKTVKFDNSENNATTNSIITGCLLYELISSALSSNTAYENNVSTIFCLINPFTWDLINAFHRASLWATLNFPKDSYSFVYSKEQLICFLELLMSCY